MQIETIVLGDDEKKFEALKLVLKELGAIKVDSSSGVAGSVELETWILKVGIDEITIESDNYEGVSIRGPHQIVSKIVDLIQQKIK